MELERPIFQNDGEVFVEKEPVFSPDGSRCAFRYHDKEQCYVNIDEKAFGPFDWVQAPKFSADSSLFGFIYKNGGLSYLNLNGKIHGGYHHFAFRFIEQNRVVMVYERDGDIYIDEI